MSEIVTDLSVPKNWIARRGFNNQFTVTFLEGEDPFDLTTYTFTLYIRKPGGSTNLITLTQGSGLTNSGATGILTVLLTAANSITVDSGGYYFELDYSVGGISNPLIHGIINLVDQLNGEAATDSLTLEVTMSGTDIALTVSVVGNLPTQVSTQTTTATLTPSPTYDAFALTAQASALTLANPSTDYGNFDGFVVRIKDNGTARALTFGNKYRAQGAALPTTTTLGKAMIIGCLYDSSSDKYDTLFSEEV